MSFTREQWAVSLLASLGNTNPLPEIVTWLVGWTTKETIANSGARYNLLNTTQPFPGATIFNSVGVRNYNSYQDGISANTITLENGYYPSIVQGFKSNNTSLFTDTPSTEILNELTKWSGSDASLGYGLGLLTMGNSHMQDSFNYGSSPMPVPIHYTPTPIQIAAANKHWNSVMAVPPRIGSGIYNAWLQDYVDGIFHGPPLSDEYASTNWHGDPIITQEFAYAWVEWSFGAATWYH